MSKLLRGIGDSITAVRDSFSPLKPSSEEPTAHMEATLDTDTRKRKIDPYDDMPEGQGSIQVARKPLAPGSCRLTLKLTVSPR